MAFNRPNLAALAALIAGGVHAAMGPAFSTGPVSSNSFITSATSTLVLPQYPTDNPNDYFSLWVGMGTSAGDLIQSAAASDFNGPWNIFPYTLKDNNGQQQAIQGSSTPANPGDHVTMDCKWYSNDNGFIGATELIFVSPDVFDSSTGNYTQYLSLNGQLVGTLSTSDGQAQGWGTATECSLDSCGYIPSHQWINTEIVLSEADPDYINTVGMAQGVTGDMVTSDGGTTWTIDTITIPAYTYAGNS